MQERLGIAGSGAIACGLALTAARNGGDVLLWARSNASAARARANVEKTCAKWADEGVNPERVRSSTVSTRSPAPHSWSRR